MPKTVPHTLYAPDPTKNPGEKGERGTSALPPNSAVSPYTAGTGTGATSGREPLATMRIVPPTPRGTAKPVYPYSAGNGPLAGGAVPANAV